MWNSDRKDTSEINVIIQTLEKNKTKTKTKNKQKQNKKQNKTKQNQKKKKKETLVFFETSSDLIVYYLRLVC